jgi:hypothetical protein
MRYYTNQIFMERTCRDEPIRVVIYICMKTTQGNFLCSFHYQKIAKPPCFSYYLLCVFFYKIGEQEGRTGSAQQGKVCPWWGEVSGGERGRRMNTRQVTYTHY